MALFLRVFATQVSGPDSRFAKPTCRSLGTLSMRMVARSFQLRRSFLSAGLNQTPGNSGASCNALTAVDVNRAVGNSPPPLVGSARPASTLHPRVIGKIR